jgi:hypothetical protein
MMPSRYDYASFKVCVEKLLSFDLEYLLDFLEHPTEGQSDFIRFLDLLIEKEDYRKHALYGILSIRNKTIDTRYSSNDVRAGRINTPLGKRLACLGFVIRGGAFLYLPLEDLVGRRAHFDFENNVRIKRLELGL